MKKLGLAVIVVLGLMTIPVPATVQDARVTTPVWSKADQFWYRRTIPGGFVWLTVDARTGAREPLFDHQRLAIELNLRAGTDYTPLTLPLADPSANFVVKHDGSNAYIEGALAIEFVMEGQPWRCDLQLKWNWNKVPPTDYECLSRPPGASRSAAVPVEIIARSPDGRWDALVKGANVVVRPSATTAGPTTALSTDGVEAFAYHAGSIRWSTDSRSVAAYRVHEKVWLSESLTGLVKNDVVRGEWPMPR